MLDRGFIKKSKNKYSTEFLIFDTNFRAEMINVYIKNKANCLDKIIEKLSQQADRIKKIGFIGKEKYMENVNENILLDVELKAKAQITLNKKGLDLTTELNEYLLKIVEEAENMPKEKNLIEGKLLQFSDMPKDERERRLNILNSEGSIAELSGVFQGMIWIADDFDEPLDCLKDYMP